MKEDMMLAKGRNFLQAALESKYAVGAFNANGAEYVQAITQAAQEEGAPVIVQISPGAIRYLGLDIASAIAKTAAGLVEVPVVLHLDHGVTYEQNINAIEAGFTSVMYDGSSNPLEENIKVSASIVKKAHPRGIPVEAELGKIPKIEDYADMLPPDYDYTLPPPWRVQKEVIKLMAKPDDVERFLEETGCDSLAAAIGSIHGMKNDVQPLCIERLREIRKRCPDIPIVCHGSSGVIQTRKDLEAMKAKLKELHKQGQAKDIVIPDGWGCMQEAIEEGLAKINIATAISMAFLEGMKAVWDADPEQKDSRKITGPGRDKMKDTIKDYMKLFGCSGRIAVSDIEEEVEEDTEVPE